MSYWRMQLHPGGSREATRHAASSLAANFIGLGAGPTVGDLMLATPEQLPQAHRDYLDFATGMAVGDWVLIFVHHFPFALCRIAGEYNYIRQQCPELGMWFRHFRRVDDVRFYADRETDARKWEQIIMTDTVSRLKDSGSKSYKLIDEWLAAAWPPGVDAPVPSRSGTEE
jgi:hypothetical protein